MLNKAIAIDIDDVLASHAEAFVEFSNKYYNTKWTIEDYDDDWKNIWQVDHQEAERRAAEFHQPESVYNFVFKEEARGVLQNLKEHYTLYIVTARREKHIDLTIEWIEKHLPGIFSGVHFVPIWEPNNKITKLDICQEIGADYLIDDLPRHCNLAASGGIKAILFGDYKWNRDVETHENVVRCKDWQGLGEYMLNRS